MQLCKQWLKQLLLIGVSALNVAYASTLGLTINGQTSPIQVNGSEIVTGQIANGIGVDLSTDELFFNFWNYNPNVLMFDQILGLTPQIVKARTSSAPLDLFRITVAKSAVAGVNYSFYLSLSSDAGDLTDPAQFSVRTGGEAPSTAPEPSTAVLIASLLLVYLLWQRGRRTIQLVFALAVGSGLPLHANAQIPVLSTAEPAITTDSSGQLLINIGILNTGLAAISGVQITSATLGGHASVAAMPMDLGTLGVAQESLASFPFAPPAADANARQLLVIRGTYLSGTTPEGFTLNRLVETSGSLNGQSVWAGPDLFPGGPPIRDAMNAPFLAGRLPAPEPTNGLAGDELASALAVKVAAGGSSSVGALMQALLSAGFQIHGPNGIDDDTVIGSATPGQGIAIEGWEIAFISRLYAQEYAVGIHTLGKSLAKAAPAFASDDLVPGIVAGLQTGATSPNPSKRFLARFLIELGRQGNNPYDFLSSTTDFNKVQLDPIQLFLIVLRLTGDIASVASPQNTSSAAAEQRVREATAALPCNLNETAETILDVHSTLLTQMFSQIIERAELPKGATGTLSVLSALATLAKIIAAYAVLDAKIEMDAPVLRRTQTTKPGETHTLTATLRNNTGNWQIVNCLRPLMNMFAIDFSLPQDGPVAGAGVEWRLTDDGRAPWYMQEGNLLTNFIDWLTGNGIVYLETAGPESRESLAPWAHVTNEEGESMINVTGSPQARDISHEQIKQVNKSFTVKVNVQLKRSAPTGSGLAKEALDILSSSLEGIIGLYTGDFELTAGMLIEFAGQTLLRSHWYSPAARKFPVIDWEPCNGKWSGNASYELHRHITDSGRPPATVGSSNVDEVWYQTANVQSTILDSADLYGDVDAILNMPVDATYSYRKQGSFETFCILVEPYVCLRDQEKDLINLSGEAAPSQASISVYNGKYQISLPLAGAYGNSSSSSTSASICPANAICQWPNAFTSTFTSNSGGPAYPESQYLSGSGDVDPKNPGVFQGSSTQEFNGGDAQLTVTYKWNLARSCGQ